ncbi:hypothetical protein B1M42_14905 [Salmonella enterica subsp. enterica serovar Dublin]|nr:hypothetical protein B1M42_14905 [Salmonella enterica subsp. enterica serovar Dublin]
MGGFPHGTGARQGGRIPTRHRRPARWADFHTAPAPGKVGGFPRSTGARQGGRIPTRHRRPARWADFHNFNYTFVLFVDCAAQRGAGRDGAVSPVTGRAAAANSQYGAATRRRAAVPTRRRAAPTAHPVGDVRQLRGGGLGYGLAGRGVGLLLRSVPQFPAICGRCPVESGAVAFHALTGIWRHIAFDETQPNRSHQARMLFIIYFL